eukprot:GHRR01022582.1.p2 GENE.GHRR01022582.1~~GHRR01022582.1.p2  ORF type:complete len:137 (+),score=33.71 GHRR01022582.1:278-688(+)
MVHPANQCQSIVCMFAIRTAGYLQSNAIHKLHWQLELPGHLTAIVEAATSKPTPFLKESSEAYFKRQACNKLVQPMAVPDLTKTDTNVHVAASSSSGRQQQRQSTRRIYSIKGVVHSANTIPASNTLPPPDAGQHV